MGKIDIVQANTRSALGPSEMSLIWQYRALTSGPKPTRTYSSWSNINALVTAGGTRQEFDEKREEWRWISVDRLRVADSEPALSIGDQVKSPSGSIYHVHGQSSSSPGTIVYDIGRDMIALAGPQRGGGA